MIDIEVIAKNILKPYLEKQQKMDIITKAKIEYGLCIVLSIGIELFFAILLSTILKTTFYIVIIMPVALTLRFFTGGTHCSSYNRCLLFTTAYFLPISLIAKYIHHYLEDYSITYICFVLLLIVTLILYKRRIGLRVVASWILVIILSVLLLPLKLLSLIALTISLGLIAQTFTLTSYGKSFVILMDKLMQRNGL